MPFPDLSAGRAAIERMQNDACRVDIIADIDDAVLDLDTLELTRDAADAFYSGPCLFSAMGRPREVIVGDGRTLLAAYEASLPFAVDAPPEGARFEVTAVDADQGDPSALGMVLWVVACPLDTLRVDRTLWLTRERPAAFIGEQPA